MAQELKVVRYAMEYYRGGEKFTSLPLFSTMREARAAARADNKRFGAMNAKPAKAVEIDMTPRVIEWAEAISYAARNPEIDVKRTQESILALIQFTQRGY